MAGIVKLRVKWCAVINNGIGVVEFPNFSLCYLCNCSSIPKGPILDPCPVGSPSDISLRFPL